MLSESRGKVSATSAFGGVAATGTRTASHSPFRLEASKRCWLGRGAALQSNLGSRLQSFFEPSSLSLEHPQSHFLAGFLYLESYDSTYPHLFDLPVPAFILNRRLFSHSYQLLKHQIPDRRHSTPRDNCNQRLPSNSTCLRATSSYPASTSFFVTGPNTICYHG